MEIKLTKIDDKTYNAVVKHSFNIGKVYIDEKMGNKVIVGMEINSMKEYVKRRLFEIPQSMDSGKKNYDDLKERFDTLLEEYEKICLLKTLNIKNHPLEIKDGKIEGLNNEAEIEVTGL